MDSRARPGRNIPYAELAEMAFQEHQWCFFVSGLPSFVADNCQCIRRLYLDSQTFFLFIHHRIVEKSRVAYRIFEQS